MAEKKRPTFTVQCLVPERDPNTDQPIFLESEPGTLPQIKAKRDLGSFTFTFPTFWEKRTIETTVDRAVNDAGGLTWMRRTTSCLILLGAYYPALIQETPDGFVLEDLVDDEDIRALWEAMEGGLKTGPKK